MPCDTQANLTPAKKAAQLTAIQRLEAALAQNEAQLVIGPQGSISFRGWKDNQGVADLCAYRRLASSNSAALRRAVARAEVTAGRQVDARAVAAGVHSHDGGASWGTH